MLRSCRKMPYCFVLDIENLEINSRNMRVQFNVGRLGGNKLRESDESTFLICCDVMLSLSHTFLNLKFWTHAVSEWRDISRQTWSPSQGSSPGGWPSQPGELLWAVRSPGGPSMGSRSAVISEKLILNLQ